MHNIDNNKKGYAGYILKKILRTAIIIVLVFTMITNIFVIKTYAAKLDLYAISAVLIDCDSKRILYGKNENEVRAMASTTKIMTLLIALEYGNPKDTVTFSAYAAAAPDVQLNAAKGEQYTLSDLLYIMMLRSYNDVAVAVAEHVGARLNGHDASDNLSREDSKRDVARFISEMNKKAKSLSLLNTYFITPNGLDAKDENGTHSTTAYELALLAAYAMDNKKLLSICGTRSHSFRELNGKRAGTVTNANLFLDMMNNAVGFKTGFTGEAGYCFVGGIIEDDRRFVSVVLGSGWPPNKSYKWTDTKKLMNFGTKNYFRKKIFEACEFYNEINVKNGVFESVETYIPFEVSYLLSDWDEIKVIYEVYEYITAPVNKNSQVGTARIYMNGEVIMSVPILTKASVGRKNFIFYLSRVFREFMP